MALYFSTALRNYIAAGGSYRDALKNGRMVIYNVGSGIPTSADAASTGSTDLVTISNASAGWGAEIRAKGSVRITGSTVAGSLTALTVGGLDILVNDITWSSSNTSTASLIAAELNKNSITKISAEWSGEYCLLHAPFGAGTPTWTVSSTASGTLTRTDSNFSTGTAPSNGLSWAMPVAGVMSKDGTWSGTVSNSGTASFFRIYGSLSDSGAADSSYVYFRVQGTCGTSGTDYIMSSLTLTAGNTHTVDVFNLTFPAS